MKYAIAIIMGAICAGNSLAYYQAEQGRWTCRDPKVEEGGKNLYAFNYNNPVRYFDPDGRAPQLIGRNPDGSGIYSPDIDWGEWDPRWGGRGNSSGPFGDNSGISPFSLSGYYGIGASFEYDTGTCCKDKYKYEWATTKTCVGFGVGAGVKGLGGALGLGPTKPNSDCPESGTVLSAGNGANFGPINIFDISAPFAEIPFVGEPHMTDGADYSASGLSLGDFSLSMTWRFAEMCSTTRTKFEKAGCCDE